MLKNLFLILILILLLSLLTLTAGAQAVMITFGMEGSHVIQLQENLSYLGYEVEVDGQFGQKTLRAVEDFQREHGLMVDGIVGPKTKARIEEVSTTVIHVVDKGDTLLGLALLYGTGVDSIRDSNEITGDTIYLGDELVIPYVTRKTFPYIVEEGDSLGYIANKHGTTIDTIKELNQLSSDDIFIGEKLTLPKMGTGGGFGKSIRQDITHVVRRGETLSQISQRYDVPVEAIRGMNQLSSDLIIEDQNILIPTNPSSAQSQPVTRGSLLWPVKGQISSPFGWRIHPIYHHRQFHGGIDIVVPTGTPVRAAASGVVVESQWEGGFGKTVVLDHGDGIKTSYAHNSRLVASVGDKVFKGEVIAYSGNTGMSTGPHLDFRVYVNGDVEDPLEWLP